MESAKMENENCFAVVVGDMLIGIDLPIQKAQKLSRRAIKKCGKNMAVIVNQKFIDIESLLSM